MLIIVDYGTGNLCSVQNSAEESSALSRASRAHARDIAAASALILPGAGHFDFGMRSLEATSTCVACSTSRCSGEMGAVARHLPRRATADTWQRRGQQAWSRLDRG